MFNLSLIGLAMGFAALSIFLDFCLEEPNVFSGFGKYMRFHYYHQIERRGYYLKRIRSYNGFNSWKLALYKVTGGCIYCTNPYIVFLLMLLVGNFASIKVGVFNYFITIGLAHIFIRLWRRYV